MKIFIPQKLFQMNKVDTIFFSGEKVDIFFFNEIASSLKKCREVFLE